MILAYQDAPWGSLRGLTQKGEFSSAGKVATLQLLP